MKDKVKSHEVSKDLIFHLEVRGREARKVYPGSAIFRLHLRLSVDRKWPIIFWFSSLDKPTYWGPQLPSEPFCRITNQKVSSKLHRKTWCGVPLLPPFPVSTKTWTYINLQHQTCYYFSEFLCSCIKVVSVKNGVDSVSISAVENCQQQKCTILRV